MVEWNENYLYENSIPSIMKVIHTGDFVELIYENSDPKLIGGFVTTLTSDSPNADKGANKRYIIGISTTHSDHNENEQILWAANVKKFRIIHK